MKSFYDREQEDYLYLRSNGIPNYQPSIGGKNLVGIWSNEFNNTDTEDNKLYYAVYYRHRGWFDNNNRVLGNMYKNSIRASSCYTKHS